MTLKRTCVVCTIAMFSQQWVNTSYARQRRDWRPPMTKIPFFLKSKCFFSSFLKATRSAVILSFSFWNSPFVLLTRGEKNNAARVFTESRGNMRGGSYLRLDWHSSLSQRVVMESSYIGGTWSNTSICPSVSLRAFSCRMNVRRSWPTVSSCTLTWPGTSCKVRASAVSPSARS